MKQIEILRGNHWHPVEMEDLHVGDFVRIFEKKNGEFSLITDANENFVFRVDSEPYNNSDGYLTVDIITKK